MKKPLSEQNKQHLWEVWFVLSVILFLTYLFVGTLENSRTFLPNWLPFMLISMVNLLVCIIYGLKKPKD